MVNAVELAENCIATGGHLHRFCSELRFSQWVTDLDRGTENVSVDDPRRCYQATETDKIPTTDHKPL